MSTYILTSLFPDGLLPWQAKIFAESITARKRFVFVASEFERGHDITDMYFHEIIDMLAGAGICFEEARVADGRLTAAEAQQIVREADAVWLTGGDTLAQFGYLNKYGLAEVIRQHGGVVIGMSAGTINLANTAVLYDPPYGQTTAMFYEALGCVDITADPHFDAHNPPAELLDASEHHPFYGLCDNGIILRRPDGTTEFYGEVYRLDNRRIERVN